MRCCSSFAMIELGVACHTPFLRTGLFFTTSALGKRMTLANYCMTSCVSELAGKPPKPSAAILDSQSAKTTGQGGPRGYGAEKNSSAESDIFSLAP